MQLIDRVYAKCVPPVQPYFELLDKVHQYLLPRTYVEVGVSGGRSLTLALPGTRCVGIDPNPRIALRVPRRTRIFAETSDQFFAGNDLKVLLGGLPLDLAFIDGMHNFEFALRDFMNLERASSPSTTIFVHDCLPISEETASREVPAGRVAPEVRSGGAICWSGDVWRLILLLRKWRPDLTVAVVDSAPTGVGLIRGLDASSHVLHDHYDEIVDEYLSVPYDVLDDGSKEEKLNVIPGDWSTVKALLPGGPFRRANLELMKLLRVAEAAGNTARRRVRRVSLT